MRFEKPVRVAITPLGNVSKVVQDAASAGDVLLNRWHGAKGPKHLAARKAVLKALENAHDHVLAERARKAFAAAAEEADILMPDAPRPEPIPGFRTADWNRPKRKLKRDR